MNHNLPKALAALAPVGMLSVASIILFLRKRGLASLLQLIGAACLVLVVLAHIFEGLQLFAWMGWGLEHSPGHYLDLSSAILGATSFPIGYLLDAVGWRRPQ